MNDFLSSVSNWLWDYYLLATALLAAVLLGTRTLTQPARRVAIHWATAVGLLLLALLCAIPGWSLLHMTSPPPPEFVALPENLQQAPSSAIQIADLPQNFHLTVPETVAVDETTEFLPVEQGLPIDYGILVSYAIGIGALISLLWLAMGAWQVHRLRGQAKPAPEEIHQMLAELTKQSPNRPAIGISERLTVAVAVGLRRPLVLLPNSLIQHSGPHELRTVLAHELAHIGNRDLWLLAIVRSLLPLLWVHPLYWLWRRGLRLDQETLADAAACEQTSQADYADQLVTWARSAAGIQTPRFASSVGLWESPSQLKRRVAVLLDEKLTVLRECSRKWRWGSIIVLLALSSSLSLITFQPESVAVEELPPETSLTDPAKNPTVKELSSRQYQPMQWPQRISGVVQDEQGKPVFGAIIKLGLKRIHQFEIGRWDEPVMEIETLSKRDGSYSFDTSKFPEMRHRPISLSLSAVAEGHSDARTWDWRSEKKNNVASNYGTLVMPRSRTVSGRCVDPEGHPVARAVIRTNVDYGAGSMHEPLQCDAQGQFEIEIARNEKAQIWILSAAWAPKYVEISRTAEQLGEISLEKGTALEGTVRNTDGSPCRGCVVVAESKFDGNFDRVAFGVETATKTDDAGQYRLPPLKGEYKLYLAQASMKAELPGRQFLVSRDSPPAVIPQWHNLSGIQPTLTVDINATDTIKLSGTVRWTNGTPVEDCDMRFAFGGGAWAGRTRTDTKGNYTFEIPRNMPNVTIFAFGARDKQAKWHIPRAAKTMPLADHRGIRLQNVRVEEILDQDRSGYDWVVGDEKPSEVMKATEEH